VRVITPADRGLLYSLSSRLAGTILPRDKQGNAMTDLNNEVRELPIDEMTGEELDTVTGGMPSFTGIAIAVFAALKAYDAKFGIPIRDIATELP
jgi:hypothetical protein